MSDKRRFTIDEIITFLQEYEKMRAFKAEAVSGLGINMALLEHVINNINPMQFFSWIKRLSDDDIKSILEEKSHDK